MLLTRLPPWRAAKYNVHKNIPKYTTINIDQYWSILINIDRDIRTVSYSFPLIQPSSHVHWHWKPSTTVRSLISCFWHAFHPGGQPNTMYTKTYPNTRQSILINIDRYWSISIGISGPSHTAFLSYSLPHMYTDIGNLQLQFVTKTYTYTRQSILIDIDQYWSILINIDQYWSISINIDCRVYVYVFVTNCSWRFPMSVYMWGRLYERKAVWDGPDIPIDIDQYRSILINIDCRVFGYVFVYIVFGCPPGWKACQKHDIRLRTVVEGFQCQCTCEEGCMRGKLYETVLISRSILINIDQYWSILIVVYLGMFLCTLYLAALQGGRRVKSMISDSEECWLHVGT